MENHFFTIRVGHISSRKRNAVGERGKHNWDLKSAATTEYSVFDGESESLRPNCCDGDFEVNTFNTGGAHCRKNKESGKWAINNSRYAIH